MTYCKELKKIIKSNGFRTQVAFADRIGKNERVLSRWLHGGNVMSYDELTNIRDKLQLPPDQYLPLLSALQNDLIEQWRSGK